MSAYSGGETTKEKIVNAAGELAGELGLDNVTTRAVAERSGENIGSIHYHFGGKNGLFEAVVREAKRYCLNKAYEDRLDAMDEACSPAEFSAAVRLIVQTEVTDLFRSNRPAWHSHLIYQVLQRDDRLYDLVMAEMMDPNLASLIRFFRLIKPSWSEEDAFLQVMVVLMPIFSHATYMKAIRRSLGVESYSESYLQKLENVLVRQTQLLLGLPEDL